MERLTVGNNRPFPGKTTLTRVPPSFRNYSPPPANPVRREDLLQPHKSTKESNNTPTNEPVKASSGSVSECRERAGTDSRTLLSSLPSPDQPLLRLMGREIYPEDLMLVLLILALKEDNADPGLVAALIYLLFC